jgi:peptidoglycan/xylan/chitin deacetylase (PgdA/CDA1 family)
MYHNFSEDSQIGYVDAKTFDWQVQYIKKHFTPMKLVDLSKSVLLDKQIPSNVVVITVDDGYANFYEVAYPILKKHKVPASLFVTSGFIDDEVWLWPDKLKYILTNTEKLGLSIDYKGEVFKITGEHYADWEPLNAYCLSIGNEEKHVFIQMLSEWLDVDISTAPPKFSSCTWEQLKEMEQNGIEIGGHTINHPSLTKVTLSECEEEIRGSLIRTNEELGENIRTFCYPNGQPTDYSPEIMKITEKAGFLNAAAAFHDKRNIDLPFSWRRFNGDKQRLEFLKTLHGLELIGHKVKGRVRCEY